MCVHMYVPNAKRAELSSARAFAKFLMPRREPFIVLIPILRINVMLCHVMLRHIMLYYVMLCYNICMMCNIML